MANICRPRWATDFIPAKSLRAIPERARSLVYSWPAARLLPFRCLCYLRLPILPQRRCERTVRVGMDTFAAPRYPGAVMVRSRRRLGRIARLLLVALFCTQAAFAASACLMPSAKLAQAMAAMEQSECDDVRGMNASLCHAHCTSEDQSLDAGGQPVVAAPSLPVLVVPSIQQPKHTPYSAVHIERSTDPPIPIRFCSFLI